MLVRSRMTADVLTVSPTTPLGEAYRIARKNRIRHLPIVENGKFLGLVSDRDLRLAAPPGWAEGSEYDALRAEFEKKTVAEVMTSADLISTTEETPIEDAARQLFQHRIGCLPVMRGEVLVGIITETDMIKAFVELFSVDEDECRIEIQIPNRPGELSRVVRAIGVDFKCNITGIVVPPIADAAEMVAIVHVQTRDVSELVEHLRRIGYRVGSPSIELEPDHVHERKPERVRSWAADGY